MPPFQRLPVVLLWHMHQPHYKDGLTGEYVLPWTYLHALKDYTDMAAHLEANPRARAVVNFTPVLIEQLEDIAQRVAQHLTESAALPDPVLALLGPDPIPQDPIRRIELIRALLRAQRQRMIEPFAPYLELATLAENLATPERIAYASDQFIHDLAVWYHIAWLGESVRRADTRIQVLMEQGRSFSPEQRRELLELAAQLIGAVVPRFRRLAERGQCELSVTPYGHPIIPLLLDFEAARDTQPDAPLPRHVHYPGGAQRAAWHIDESIRVFTRAFGHAPKGCWPAEGAISRGTLELLDQAGFRWAASGAGVLEASLRASGLLGPQGAAHTAGHDASGTQELLDTADLFNRACQPTGLNLECFFRDDTLSDLIGFTYATWHGDDAAQNLVHELAQLARRYAERPGRHAVVIALDGENAWEHYPFNGYYFLQALYAALADHPLLELSTLSDCLERGITALPLPRVVAGSWVHGTLATWMGETEKNAGWDLLCEAKAAFDRVMSQGEIDSKEITPQQRAALERQLALCESSDWFWWFGDYNPQDAVRQFDRLYRRQLLVLYRMLGLAPPGALSRTISSGGGAAEHGGTMRRASAS